MHSNRYVDAGLPCMRRGRKMDMIDGAKADANQAPRTWLYAITLIAALPVFQTLMTWDFDGRLSPQAFAMRHFSIPAVIGELVVFYLAARAGLTIQAVFASLTKPVLVLLSIWAVFALIALFADSSGLVNASFILLRYTLHGFCLASLVFLLSKAERFDKITWLEAISIGGLAYAALLALFCVLVPDPDNFPWTPRIPSATNIRQIANNIGIMALAPISLLLAKEISRKWLYYLVFMLIMIFLAWTGSRATILGLLVGTSIAAAITFGFTNARKIFGTLSVAIIGSFLSILLPMPNTEFGLVRMFTKSFGMGGRVSSGRDEVWIYTIQEIMKSPWIGYGSGRYTENMQRLYPIDINHPHNFVLQYVYDWGIIGGAAGLGLIVVLGFNIWQSTCQDRTLRFTAIAAYIATCSAAMIDSPLFHPLPIIVAITLIAPVLKQSEKA
jgi:O-antigen ligase